MNHQLAIVLVSLSLLAIACAAQLPNSNNRAADALRIQLDEDWKYWMTQYPELATAYGYPGQNMRWTDYSQAAIDARADYLKHSLDRLKRIERAQLNRDEQVNYDLYSDLLDTAVKGLEFHNDAIPMKGVIPHNLLMPINQLEGIQQDIPHMFAMMPAATREEYENIVLRLERVGSLIDQTIALLERGLAANMTPPKITFRDVPRQVKAQIFEDPMRSPMLEAFTKLPPGIGEAEASKLKDRAIAAYKQTVAPALAKLHDFLVMRYLPNCRETTDAASLPNGAALYAYNVKWHTTANKTPQEIHEIGLAEVKRIKAQMDKVMAATGFKGSYEEFKKFLRTDSRFYFKDAESLLTAYRDIAKRADPELAHLFGHLPQTPYGVKAVPDAIAPSQTTAYYDPGSLAAGRPAFMFANTYKLESRPKWEMEALTMHEAVPGHHVQISIAQEFQGLPEFRKNSSYTAFVEGWALYSESLGEDMGFYKDPYSKFGQLTYEMWRAIRLVVDTGLHSMGWTRDQAINFFREYAAKTDQDIIVEVDRYIVWPGQALGYKMGQLKIRELRSKAEQQLGSKFDIRQFHDVVLGHGAVPLDLLESEVNSWAGKMLQ
ncbi:MAG: DUF885 domain-containing protein [Acidobacteria bacterium]|nr:MAG: DUF885 domain-containing protein [Acidobacteriota bacterium]